MNNRYFRVIYDGPASHIVSTSRPPAEHDGDSDTYFVFSTARALLLKHLTGLRDDYASAVRRTRALTISQLDDDGGADDLVMRDGARGDA